MQSDQTIPTQADNKNITFGARLKAAREAMNLERKDAAAQLRLNEKYLVMMEKDRFAPDLPMTFVRGYLKTYAKFLQIPEFETKKALETLKPIPGTQGAQIHLPMKNLQANSTGRYVIKLFTYLIVFSMIGLAGAWWYTHPDLPNTLLAQSPLNFSKAANSIASATKSAVSTTASTQDTPANVPISTTQNSAPDNTNTVTTQVPTAPGTYATTAAPKPINAKDVDDSIAPAESQETSSAAKSPTNKQPAYMTNSNDDPLKDTNAQDNDTE